MPWRRPRVRVSLPPFTFLSASPPPDVRAYLFGKKNGSLAHARGIYGSRRERLRETSNRYEFLHVCIDFCVNIFESAELNFGLELLVSIDP